MCLSRQSCSSGRGSIFSENRNLDFSYTVFHADQMYRFRADAYFDLDQLRAQQEAINAAVRPYKNSSSTRMSPRSSVSSHEKWLILVTGITGSGKELTLDSILDLNNHTTDAALCHHRLSNRVRAQTGPLHRRHRKWAETSFHLKKERAARSADPDIIISGELRDPDTILTALEITDSGHKVFSTLHTSSAVESMTVSSARFPRRSRSGSATGWRRHPVRHLAETDPSTRQTPRPREGSHDRDASVKPRSRTTTRGAKSTR